MIKMSMQSNIREVTARIGEVGRNIEDKATMRAINRAVDAVATEANREIRKVYNIKARDVRAAISKHKAKKTQAVLTGEVVFKGRRMNLADFGGRWSRKQAGASVQVLVDGPRKIIPGTFIGTNSHSGFRGIFRRVGKARYPIVNLRSISIPQTVRNKRVDAAIRRVASDTFRKNFAQQLQYLGKL